jgi:hypothetical protein
MDATEMVNGNAHEGALEQPDAAIVGELNPDLIVYRLPRELPEEREVLARGLSVTRCGGTEAFRDSACRQSFFELHWRQNTLAP